MLRIKVAGLLNSVGWMTPSCGSDAVRGSIQVRDKSKGCHHGALVPWCAYQTFVLPLSPQKEGYGVVAEQEKTGVRIKPDDLSIPFGILGSGTASV